MPMPKRPEIPGREIFETRTQVWKDAGLEQELDRKAASRARWEAIVFLPVLVGVVIGLSASFIAARAIRGLLFGVGASDPATFIATLTVLAIVALLAGYLPARRATQVDPALALRDING